MVKYAKSHTQPWKNAFRFDSNAASDITPINQAFAADVFGTPLIGYQGWGNQPTSPSVLHFKMPVQTKPVSCTGFHLEATIGFSNIPLDVVQNARGFMQVEDDVTPANGRNRPASAQVQVLLWHQKAAYLQQTPAGAQYGPSLYVPLGGFTTNQFSPMMQPYQDLLVGFPGHIDRWVGYHNKMHERFSSDTSRNLVQDDTVAVSILYQWMPNGYPGGEIRPPLEGTVALTYVAMS